MKTLLKLDWDVLNTYIEEDLIKVNKHPEYDIWILNYTTTASVTRHWDDYTMACRGMVIDAEGNILARPFGKFKNYEEHDPSEIDMSMDYEVFEKMDGSFIVVFYYHERSGWIVASRGSFISEQAIVAEELLGDKWLYFAKNCTYCLEVIYPENRIVVNYGNKRELVLLGCIITPTGVELPHSRLITMYSTYFTIVKKYELDKVNDLLELKAIESENKEGFVIRFENGFRVKIKFTEYCRLHAILTNVSNKTVWEHMMNKLEFTELLDRVPDEFFDWLTKTAKELQDEYNEIERLALLEFVKIYYKNGNHKRGNFAEQAKESENRAILFKLYDNRPYDDIIWKRIKPEYSKPFKDGYEEITK